jgi:small subunit ribosomal protein S7
MPRRNRPPRRTIQPDIRYNSVLLAKIINKVMARGKKSTAAGIVYDAMDIIEQRTGRPPLEVVEEAVRNVEPVLEVKPRRVGGSTYQIPVEVPQYRQSALAIRWILSAARSRLGKTMARKFADELMDAARETGAAVKRREDTHRMAEANRAFAHYRW